MQFHRQHKLGVSVLFATLSFAAWAYASGFAPAPETMQQVGPKLAPAFTFEPFAPPMRNHLWMDAGQGRVKFLHFTKPANNPEATLIFIGDAIKGRFCAEDQPGKGKTGYVHFHQAAAPHAHSPKDAHGGKAGDQGYWLRHIAVGDFEFKGRKMEPGIAMNFPSTPPPTCGS
jgi:hypothetical protein